MGLYLYVDAVERPYSVYRLFSKPQFKTVAPLCSDLDLPFTVIVRVHV